MPEVGVESPLHFGQHLGEVWGNGQFSCEKLHYVAASCGNDKPIHRLILTRGVINSFLSMMTAEVKNGGLHRTQQHLRSLRKR